MEQVPSGTEPRLSEYLFRQLNKIYATIAANPGPVGPTGATGPVGPSGKIINAVSASTSTATSNTVTTPAFDTSIPQITEGVQVLTLSYTPTNAANSYVIEANVKCCNSGLVNMIASVFDGGSNALASSACYAPAAAGMQNVIVKSAPISCVNTSARTISLRVGAGSGTLYINQNNASNTLGGALVTTLEVKEYIA
jgi:hypothetical protein